MGPNAKREPKILHEFCNKFLLFILTRALKEARLQWGKESKSPKPYSIRNKMGKFPMCFGADTTLILLRVAGIIGSYATGLYTCYKIMWDPTSIRWAIVFFYVTLFAVVIPSAELGLLKHPRYSPNEPLPYDLHRARTVLHLHGRTDPRLVRVHTWCVDDRNGGSQHSRTVLLLREAEREKAPPASMTPDPEMLLKGGK